MKNWKVILLAALVLMWIVDAKPWRDDSDQERTVATAGESRSKTEERQEQEQEATYVCPRCNGSKECRVCDGKGTYYNSITGETKDCAVCKRNPGACQTCDGAGVISESTYLEVMGNESKRAAKREAEPTAPPYEEVVFCTACSSTGICKICGGSGYYRSQYDMSSVYPCSACTNGTPEEVGKCHICGGDGILYN